MGPENDPSPEVGGTPQNSAQVGGSAGVPAHVKSQPEQARIWWAVATRNESQREAAKSASVSRWKVRKWVETWKGAGWLIQRSKGGYQATDKAPKALLEVVGGTPQGSPLPPPSPGIQRPHAGKAKASLSRSINLDALSWRKHHPKVARGIVYHSFTLPVNLGYGTGHVPVQVIQPANVHKPFLLLVQSFNCLLPEDVVMEKGTVEDFRAFLLGQFDEALRKWLGPQQDLMEPLRFTGKQNVEIAWEAPANAKVGGNPQVHFGATDKDSQFSPWEKEHEQKDSAYFRLRAAEKEIQMLREQMANNWDEQSQFNQMVAARIQ